jgi:hypothetical protein
MSHKNKKTKKNNKPPKLSIKTGWNLYSQDYLAQMQPAAFELFEQYLQEEQEAGKDTENNKTIDSKNLKKIAKKLKIELNNELNTEVVSDRVYKKFHLSQILRTEAGRLWKDQDKEEWNIRAEEINSQNLADWRNAYADGDNLSLSVDDFVTKIKEYGPDSPENNIKKFKKSELIHLLGSIGLADSVGLTSKVGKLRTRLVEYYKDL